jgi:hypothetical protein
VQCRRCSTHSLIDLSAVNDVRRRPDTPTWKLDVSRPMASFHTIIRIPPRRSRDFRCYGLGRWCQRVADAVRGGSSVCGGVEPRVDEVRYKAAVTLDLRNLGKVVEVVDLAEARSACTCEILAPKVGSTTTVIG